MTDQYKPIIPKSELIHGAYYGGRCRNASAARWNGKKEKFYYWRIKWGKWFVEEIHAPEDEKYYDVFVAKRRIDIPKEEERIPFNEEGEEAPRKRG